MRIYLASSWKNVEQVRAVAFILREEGFSVYDFTEDDDQGAAFHWTEIDPDWKAWTPGEFRKLIWHERADRGFNRDFRELKACDALVCLLPCGRSAHLELGHAIGAGKPTAILLHPGDPELMYRAAGKLCLDIAEVIEYLRIAVPA